MHWVHAPLCGDNKKITLDWFRRWIMGCLLFAQHITTSWLLSIRIIYPQTTILHYIHWTIMSTVCGRCKLFWIYGQPWYPACWQIWYLGKICQHLLDEHQLLDHPICNWLYHEKGPSQYFCLNSEAIHEELSTAARKSFQNFSILAGTIAELLEYKMASVSKTNCGFPRMEGGNLDWLEDPRSLACEYFIIMLQLCYYTDSQPRHDLCICFDTEVVS